MIKNYSLFYIYKNLEDVLMVIIDNDKKPTSHERKGKVEVIYYDKEIIGYNIFDISEVIKIKTRGKIFLPSPILVKVINPVQKEPYCKLIRYQLSLVHILLCFPAEVCAVLYVGPEDIPGGNMRDPEFLRYPFGLCSFTCPGGSKHYNLHMHLIKLRILCSSEQASWTRSALMSQG